MIRAGNGICVALVNVGALLAVSAVPAVARAGETPVRVRALSVGVAVICVCGALVNVHVARFALVPSICAITVEIVKGGCGASASHARVIAAVAVWIALVNVVLAVFTPTTTGTVALIIFHRNI